MTITDTSKTVDVIAADDLNWLDKAPAPGRGFFTGKSNPRIDSFVDLLKQNPGMWAEFPDDVRASSHSNQVLSKRYPGTRWVTRQAYVTPEAKAEGMTRLFGTFLVEEDEGES